MRMPPSDLREHLLLIKDTLESLDLSGFRFQVNDTDLLRPLEHYLRLRSLTTQAVILIRNERFKAQGSFWEYLLAVLEEFKVLVEG